MGGFDWLIAKGEGTVMNACVHVCMYTCICVCMCTCVCTASMVVLWHDVFVGKQWIPGCSSTDERQTSRFHSIRFHPLSAPFLSILR